MTQIIPLSQLVVALSPENRAFFSDVIRRDQNKNGTDKGILSRMMRSEQCRLCHEEFRLKHKDKKDKPFFIKCEGIYDDLDYEVKRAALQADGDDMSLDDIKEIYDPAFWAERHMVVKNDEGDIVPFVPRFYQVEALKCTSPRKIDRWGRGMGKALSLDTPIPTPSGWTTMGAIQRGDVVFDEFGKPVTVVNVTETMQDHVCYDVVFSDGSIITADAGHLWETWTHAARKAESRKARRTGKLKDTRPVPVPQVITTEEMKATLLHGNGKRIEHNHSVLVTQPLQYTEKVLEIHPYVLGAWLGDGTSNCSQFTTADPEILEQLSLCGFESSKLVGDYRYSLGNRPVQRDATSGRMVANGSLTSLLRSLDVLDNKHVPVMYLQASVDQRLALLQGLMDTDGTVEKSGTCRFSNTNKQLSDAVAELCHGLGFKVCREERPAMLNGIQHGIDYRISFTPPLPVFRLPRKLKYQKLDKIRSTQRHLYVVEIRDRMSVPVKCIEVDSPTHLYLAGRACIPTHNSMNGVAEELQFICNNKNTYTIVLCPSKAQAQMWWDEILFQIENSPSLSQDKDFVLQKKQQPFYYIRFGNGAVISIFTAGSKSGKGADTVRGQSPRRIRLDEQDFLDEKDYQAIMPLLRRFKNSTFHGSSTPSGLRGMYWQMCNKLTEYKEFFHPITDHPAWDTDQLNYESCFAEAKTMDRYRHEWLAEFGDPSAGVFKGKFVDEATRPYEHRRQVWNPEFRYVLGVDWNGKGTGTRLCVVGYDPETNIRRIVARAVVDDPASTTKMSMAKIIELNKLWHCEDIFVDAGFGFVQDEIMRDIGARTQDPDTHKLKYIQVIDFGAKLKTNRIVPMRDPESKYLPDPKEEELARRTKPFMVEGAVMCFEGGLIEFSGTDDTLLEEQIRGYRVKTWSKGGQADTYETDCSSGDHDLDAMLLALLGVELKYGLWHTVETVKRLAQIAHVSGWGLPSTQLGPSPMAAALGQKFEGELQKQSRDAAMTAAGIPGRTSTIQRTSNSLQDDYRILHLSRQSVTIAPNATVQAGGRQNGGAHITSRTAIFKQSGQQGSGSGYGRRGY